MAVGSQGSCGSLIKSCIIQFFYLQLTYTIKSCDLKAVYRDCEPHLVTPCSEIESKTQSSIQFEWRSGVAVFHIAGLEDNVAKALELIREEFEVNIFFVLHNITVMLIASWDSATSYIYISVSAPYRR